jgi:SagB-type dehydrogenase family enzyme
MVILLIAVLVMVSTTLMAGGEESLEARLGRFREQGRFQEAAELMLDTIREGGESIEAAYEAGCFFSLAGNPEKAFLWLDRAVELGWCDKSWLEHDDDLTALHGDARWSLLIAAADTQREKRLTVLPAAWPENTTIDLPAPKLEGGMSVEQALYQRRSVREFTEQSLTMQEVSQLLWSAYGVTKPIAPERLRGGFKTAPSAGARFPLEIYLAAWRVDGLAPGFYHYLPEGHKLVPVRLGDFHDQLGAACHNQGCVVTAPVSLIWSAIYERMTSRYGERGRSRYVPMDLGHSGENVYLQVESLGLGTVAVGAFDDLLLQTSVPMTRAEEPLYVMPVGHRR